MLNALESELLSLKITSKTLLFWQPSSFSCLYYLSASSIVFTLLPLNCSDLENFGAMFQQPEFKQWDIDNNCVDTLSKLELIE